MITYRQGSSSGDLGGGGRHQNLVGWPGSFSVPHLFSMWSFLVTRAKPPLHKESSL
jgi:hypothetical protein